MDASLFRMYIRDVILPLYPNISKNYVMENGKVIKGPVFLKTDSSPGRFKEDIIQDEGEVVKFKAKKLRLGQYELIYIDESNVAVNDMSEMKKITI